MEALVYASLTSHEKINKWGSMPKLPIKTLDSNASETVFKVDYNINAILKLWSGPLTSLRIQAIVVTVNSLMESKQIINKDKLDKLGGRKYAEEFVTNIIGCKTGEVRVLDALDLPCNYILHTVAPRYNEKYESAAVNALYNCYRNSLMTAVEKGIRSIGFSALHVYRYEFPHELAIHLEARVIRRFLERYQSTMDSVVVHVPDDLEDLYRQIFPIYFPRNDNEQVFSAIHMPEDIGNENGQPTQPERSIRISAFPYGPGRRPDDDSDEEEGEEEVEEGDEMGARDDSDESKALSLTRGGRHVGNDITSSGKHCLAQPQVAPALLRESLSHIRSDDGLARTLKSYEVSVATERKFDRLLRQSRKNDMTIWTDKRVFYQCGKDMNNNPIFLVLERNIPHDLDIMANDATAFIISQLEKAAKGKQFSIVYAQTLSNVRPSRNFFMEVCQLLNARFYKYLDLLCMLHGSFYCRTLNWILLNFLAPELKPRTAQVPNLRQLYRLLNPTLLELPEFIYDYDKQVGGSNVYERPEMRTLPRHQQNQLHGPGDPGTPNNEL